MADEADLAFDSEQRHLTYALAAQRSRSAVLLTEAMAQSSGWLVLGVLKFERMPFLAIALLLPFADARVHRRPFQGSGRVSTAVQGRKRRALHRAVATGLPGVTLKGAACAWPPGTWHWMQMRSMTTGMTSLAK